MELKIHKGSLWFYFQIGKYYLDKRWYERRIVLDFFFQGLGFSIGKVFEEVREIKKR